MLGKFFWLSIFLFTFCSFSTARAATPANDNRANAQLIQGASGSVAATTSGATREFGEFPHTGDSAATVYRTVWFKYVSPTSKSFAFEVTGAANNFDAALAIYKEESGAFSTVSRNNDTNGNAPRVEFNAAPGTYYIVVGIFNDQSAAGGAFTLNWSQTDKPTNDDFANALTLQQFPSGSVAATNYNATQETGEPSHATDNTRSIWFKFTNPTASDCSITFTTADSYDVNFGTTIAVYQGATMQTLQPVVKNINFESSTKSRATFLAKAGATYRVAVDADTFQGGSIILRWNVTKVGYNTNFHLKTDGDATVYYDDVTNFAVFRPSDGTWYWLDRDNNYHAAQFGLSGDQPVAADYDGDGRTDLAVTRDEGGKKVWFISNSFDNSFRAVQWGLADDKAVPGDYDFDGRMDIAVFRPSSGVWHILRSSDGDYSAKQFGQAGDVPVLGDFKNTGSGTDLAVFRPSNGFWYIAEATASNPAQNFISFQFGQAGDKPVAADYDGDGKTDFAVWRPTDGYWYIFKSRGDKFQAVQWGAAGDQPQPGDYDTLGDNDADFAVYRPGDRVWYISKHAADGTMQFQQWGAPGDIPASSLEIVPQ